MGKNNVISLHKGNRTNEDLELLDMKKMPQSYEDFVQSNEECIAFAVRMYLIHGMYFNDKFYPVEISKDKEREILKKKKLPSSDLREVELEVNGENMKIDASRIVIGH